MYQDLLNKVGLNQNESITYDFLIRKGTSSAARIIKNTPLKRGVVYNALEDLIKKKLVSKKIKEKKSYFRPAHPEKIRAFVEEKENELQKAERELDANMNKMVSDFNLISGRPGIRFFEGIEGIKKVLEDSLTSTTTIQSYADVEAVVKYIDKLNQDYVKKRDALGIKKQVILVDSKFGRDYLKDYHQNTTDIKFIKQDLSLFESVMQIYENKVSYITLSEKSMIGVIIKDPTIYKMNKSIFDHTWQTAKTFDQLDNLSKAQ